MLCFCFPSYYSVHPHNRVAATAATNNDARLRRRCRRDRRGDRRLDGRGTAKRRRPNDLDRRPVVRLRDFLHVREVQRRQRPRRVTRALSLP